MKVIMKNSTLDFVKEKEFTKVFDGLLSTTFSLDSPIASGKEVYAVVSDPDNVHGSASDPYFELILRGVNDPTPQLGLMTGDIRTMSFPKTGAKKTLTFEATRVIVSLASNIQNKLVAQIYVR